MNPIKLQAYPRIAAACLRRYKKQVWLKMWVSVGNSRDCSLRNGHDHSLQKTKSLPELIGAFKTTSSKLIHKTGLKYFQWQKSFYDHIIRDEFSLFKIQRYIRNNPVKWELDRYYK